MRNLLVPLLAALELPTAVNAQPTYLKCDLNEQRSNVQSRSKNNIARTSL